jgi:flagellar M-ring protein FliF
MEVDVREQLERVVGPGNADVKVNVTLDAANRERTEEHYDQAKVALRSEHKVEELTGSTEAGVAGVPGARSNLPDAPPPAGSAEVKEEHLTPGGGVLRRSQTRNWEVDRVTEKTTTPPGGIGRLTVAVLLNGKYEKHGKASVFVPRSADELASLDKIVRTAVGFDADRGDALEIKTAEFQRPSVAADEVEKPLPAYRKWLPYAAAGAAAFFLLSLVILVWRGAKKTKKRSMAPALAAAQAVPVLDGIDPPKAALTEGDSELGLDRRAKALELAAKDPATAAVVIRKWLNTAALPTAARS